MLGKNRNNNVFGNHGFTLVELLTVVAIIGMLAALITPGIMRARDRADDVVCKSQLRQWGHSFLLYLQDNRQRFPSSYEVETQSWWHTRLEPELRQDPYANRGRHDIAGLFCPTGRRWRRSEEFAPGSRSTWNGYAANDNICGFANYAQGRPRRPYSALDRLSSTLLLVDSRRAPAAPWGYRMEHTPTKRHREGSNVLFLDWHVGWRPYEDIATNEDDIWGDRFR